MRLEDTVIYPYIKAYVGEIKVGRYHRGAYIARGGEDFAEIYFILTGQIQIECVNRSGKALFVDKLGEDEFFGKISYMYDQDFWCDIIAVSDVEILRIEQRTLRKLRKDASFMNLFFFKTSSRIYCMYKKLMMKNLFKADELLAYYLTEHERGGRVVLKNMDEIAKLVGVSRKGLYNQIYKFSAQGLLRKEQRQIVLLAGGRLREICEEVRFFNQNRSGGRHKFWERWE